MRGYRGIKWLVFVGLFLGAIFLLPTEAQANPVTVTGVVTYCDHLDIDFTTAGITNADPIEFVIRGPGNVYLGGATYTGVGPGGNPYNTLVYFDPPQPNGTLLSLQYGQPGNLSTSGAVACGSGGGGSTGGGGSSPSANVVAPPQAPPIWEGYTDGRLNPDPSENYSLYCEFDTLRVWANDNLLAEFPITQLLNLGSQSSIQVNDVTVSRLENDPDIYQVEGNNGYNAPAYANKTFNINECLEQNGSDLEDDDEAGDAESFLVDPCSIDENLPQIALEWVQVPATGEIFGTFDYFYVYVDRRVIIDVNIEDVSDNVEMLIRVFNNEYNDTEIGINHTANFDEYDGMDESATIPTDYPLQLTINPKYENIYDGDPAINIVITVVDEIGCTVSKTLRFHIYREEDRVEATDANSLGAFLDSFWDFMFNGCKAPGPAFVLFPYIAYQRRKRKGDTRPLHVILIKP